jgi:type IV pilus assembly protein PilO
VAKRLNDLPGRSQIAVFAALSAALGAVAWQFVVSPVQTNLAAREARAATLLADVARARATAARLPAVQREVQTLELSLRRTTAVLPDEKDPQDVLRNLHELATESALDISSFTPKAIVNKAQYSEWPIELGLNGGYHDLGHFLDRVATMSRLMSVTDLHIRAAVKPTGKATITAACTATTFVFNKETGATAPANLSARAAAAEGQQ